MQQPALSVETMITATRQWILGSAALLFLCSLWLASKYVLEHQVLPPIASHPPTNASPSFGAPHLNVWADLTKDDAADVLAYLYHSEELNLTHPTNASSWDNHVAIVEALTPNKTDVIALLEGGIDSIDRWARVIVNEGAKDQAVIAEYMVSFCTHRTSSMLTLPGRSIAMQ